MNENKIKALFPEGIETITISKNDYDRLYGQLTYENIILQSKIDKAIELIKKAMIENDITGNGTLNLNELLDILKEDK